MKKNLTIIFLFLHICTFAQRTRVCANAYCDSVAKMNHPELSLQKMRYEQALESYINGQKNQRVASEIIRIPVVVHIIHNQANNAITGNNISDEQIYSQIKVLNEDYRRKAGTMGFNSNPIGADVEIEFFLANIDPNGNPSSGITRSYTAKKIFNITSDNDRQTMSNLSYWDSNKYLNIWVGSFNSGIIGYGEFPYAETISGLSVEATESLDGVYIDYTVFGRKIGTNTKELYSFGRTATHEIGHWLGLYHTWGDEYCGTDYVADTPQTATSNVNFCNTVFSNCGGTRTQNLIEDYMDYTPDSCMNIFTQGQKDRIRAALDLSKRRRRVVNFAKFQLPPSTTLQATIFPNPTTISVIQVQVLLPNFQDFNIKINDIFGREVYSESFTDLPSTVVTLKTKDVPPGNYILTVTSNAQQVQKRLALL